MRTHPRRFRAFSGLAPHAVGHKVTHMTSLASLEGHVYPSAEPFELGREHIRAFAKVAGVTNPVHHDVEAARAAGWPDLVAPATFAAAVAQRSEWLLWRDPEVGIDFKRVVHGEERIEKQRPLIAGDVISVNLTLDRVREVRGNTMITTRAELVDAKGEDIATVWSMIVVRGEDA